jgi:hypothetical protein
MDPGGVNSISTSDQNILGQVVSIVNPVGTITTPTFDGQGHASLVSLTDKNWEHDLPLL